MTYQIKRNSDGAVLNTAELPVWISGIWECGDQRLTDPYQAAYEVVESYALLTPMQFYLAFTASERMMLKLLATAGLPANSMFNNTANEIPQDAVIAEFWATYQMAVSSNAHVDPNLPSIQEALAYLAKPTAPTPAVIVADRIPSILQGVAQ